MRVITNEEVLQVSGGNYFEEAMAAIKAFFGSNTTRQCVPGSYTNGSQMVTQTCGNGTSSLTVTGPGYTVIQTSYQGASGGVTLFGPGWGGSGTGTTGQKLVTTTIMNGQTTQTTTLP
jgi:hypothetical protein